VLKNELKRCRSKNPEGVNLKIIKTQAQTSLVAPEQDLFPTQTHQNNLFNKNKPEITEKPSTLQTASTHRTSDNAYAKNINIADLEKEMVYFSFAEKRLTHSDAYLSPIEKSPTKMPYQPRQKRAENWIPSC